MIISCKIEDVEIGDILVEERWPTIKSIGQVATIEANPEKVKLIMHQVMHDRIQYEYSLDFHIGDRKENVTIIRNE